MNIINELRKFRILNIAIFDVVATLLSAYIIHHYFHLKNHIGYTFIFAMVLAIVVHWLFEIPTTLNYWIGLGDKPVR